MSNQEGSPTTDDVKVENTQQAETPVDTPTDTMHQMAFSLRPSDTEVPEQVQSFSNFIEEELMEDFKAKDPLPTETPTVSDEPVVASDTSDQPTMKEEDTTMATKEDTAAVAEKVRKPRKKKDAPAPAPAPTDEIAAKATSDETPTKTRKPRRKKGEAPAQTGPKRGPGRPRKDGQPTKPAKTRPPHEIKRTHEAGVKLTITTKDPQFKHRDKHGNIKLTNTATFVYGCKGRKPYWVKDYEEADIKPRNVQVVK